MRWPRHSRARRSSLIVRVTEGRSGVVTHMRQHILARIGSALVCVALIGLGGCTSADSDLQQFIQQTEQQPGGRVEPLPEIKPYETYVYDDQNLRSPFVPSQASGFNSVHRD